VKPEKLLKITCIVNRLLSENLRKEAYFMGIPLLFVQPARSTLLREKRFTLDYRSSTIVEELRSDIFRFYIPRKYEQPVFSHLVGALELNQPGRGSVFSEDVFVYGLPEGSFSSLSMPETKGRKTSLLSDLVGITCIVQRGEGNALAKSVLERGISAPTVIYGRGMGLRNKLGLLRVTISVDKEVLFFTPQKQDAEDVIDLIVNYARLDHPGRGFAYMFPIRRGFIDTRIHLGKTRQLASMEQVIAAIDELKNASDWRRKTASVMIQRASGRRRSMKNLVNCTLLCREGETEDFVKAAMDAGAGGATLSRLQYCGGLERSSEDYSAAREMSDLIVSEETAARFIATLETRGFYDPRTAGILEVSSVDQARTYLAP